VSAYICGPDHFVALAVFAASRKRSDWTVDPRYVRGLREHVNALPKHEAQARGLENLCDYELATLYADLLYQENIRSVRARYPDDKWDDLPGPNIKPLHIVVRPEHFMRREWRLQPVEILVMLASWEYQSCETGDYETTLAWKLAQQIKEAAIRALPGYDKAADKCWDYYVREAA